MPVPIRQVEHEPEVFPLLTRSEVDATRTSAWYETFEDLTIPSRIIDLETLGEEEAFRDWLNGDSIFLPQDSENVSSISSSSFDATGSNSDSAPVYHLPKLNTAIRTAIQAFGGSVFPKLNWTAPRDAAFIIPQTEGGPLYCKTPADVYLVLKSSDFISHGLDYARAYASGSSDLVEYAVEDQQNETEEVPVEIVLKKYIQMIPSREWRCFVRDDVLLGVSQRDTNFYDFLQDSDAKRQVIDAIRDFWEDEVRLNFTTGGGSYIFDVYLSADMTRVTLIDFNPYRNSTDPLLFTYEELLSILLAHRRRSRQSSPLPYGLAELSSDAAGLHVRLPILKIVESASDPEANRTTPAFAGNMMPLDVMALSQGRNMGEFKDAWEEALARGMDDVSSDDDE
ncbi:D123-domain-containing protein [Kockovaella imperatae]|uniref:D123-domain-containing protein n=1 Tax=Kockovaella imperatae TaxID=4999 RepID=A0A1Y1UG76_9TREE|nr:D123-domain-containing protein [Kockovaella imperatae]ORX37070.1 D123-domain-containing protein [Kockovaella imperatae]